VELNPYGQVSLQQSDLCRIIERSLSPASMRGIGRGPGKIQQEATTMALSTILLILVILLLIGAVPAWPHSRGWGYGPSGLLGVILLILIILLLLGRI
jgi:hypothetical protein